MAGQQVSTLYSIKFSGVMKQELYLSMGLECGYNSIEI